MNNEIPLNASWLMSHLIISAMRYDASRSSYIVSNLTDIALLVHRNRDKFNPDRVVWLARDLREQATRRLNWLQNVTTSNDYNSHIAHDAYTLIAQHSEKHPDMRFCDYDWEVDCASGKVNADRRETPLMTNGGYHIQTLYDCDIATVVTAANIIDASCHRLVTSEYEGEKMEALYFPSVCAEQILDDKGRPTGDYSYKTQWKPVDRPRAWLCEEYIKEIKQP